MDWEPLWLSVRVALAATAVTSVLGVAGAFALARGLLPAPGLLEAVASLPIVLPPTVLGYYLLTVLGSRSPIGQAYESLTGSTIVFTVQGAVIAAAVASFPFCLRTARAAIADVDERYEQAARTMGLAEWRIVARVTLPLARNGILAGIALAFARALGDFGTTLMVSGNIPGETQTGAIAVYDRVQAGDDAGAAAMAAVLSAIAIAALVLVSRLTRRRA